MKMNLISQYELDLQKNAFVKDESQISAIEYLQRLSDDIDKVFITSNKTKTLWQRFFNKQQKNKINGLYLYGGVGRGKTYLMDLFFEHLSTDRKTRMHFHHFMLRVHKELNLLSGQKNPLALIAKKLAGECDLICFDEFFVEDITDAMILGGMFEALFQQGVVLVATSNIHPDDLYKNGLQRPRFLPAIELIKNNCEVFNLDGGVDYRLDRISETEIYHFPLDIEAKQQIKNGFERLAEGAKEYAAIIDINQRNIETTATSSNVLSLEFLALCDSPRSINDYIEMAILYRIVFVANVKQMGDNQNDLARRFIAMVDEFYDKHVVLIISAEVAIEILYVGDKLSFEFRRCVSRLLEMQSQSYLSQSHYFK